MSQPTTLQPLLHTTRLALRSLQEDDADALFILRSDEAVNKMVHRVGPDSIEDVRTFMTATEKRIAEGNNYYWALTKDGILIGTICLFNLDLQNSSVEIGFELLPEFRKQGYMQESFEAVRDFVFNQLKLEKLYAVVNPENLNSLTLIHKNNFTRTTSSPIDFYPPDEVYILMSH